MKTIAILKSFNQDDKTRIEHIVGDKYNICYFNSELDMLKYDGRDEIEIIFGEPEVTTANSLPSLKIIQMTWAGANLYTGKIKLKEGVRLSNASGCFGGIISEYIVGGLVSLYRRFYEYNDQIKNNGWERAADEDTLEGKRVLILGAGDIGSNTAKKLQAFGARTVGIRRKKSEPVECFDELYTFDALDDELAKTDVVIITLPGTDETYHLFDKERIAKIKQGADFVNIGRGFIVETDALAQAFESGHLRYGVIDVTEPEPLHKDHLLRKMDNVLLTPHIAGISWDENMHTKQPILDIFCANLNIVINEKLEYNKLINEVDLELGY